MIMKMMIMMRQRMMGIERISSGVQAGNCIGCVAILGAQRLSWSAYNEVGFPEVASTSKAGIIWSTPRKFRPIVQISLSLWEPLSTVGVVWIRYVSDQLPRLYIDKVICRCTIHLGGRFAHFGWGGGACVRMSSHPIRSAILLRPSKRLIHLPCIFAYVQVSRSKWTNAALCHPHTYLSSG